MTKGNKMPFGDFDFAKMFEMPKQMGDFKFAPVDMEGVVATQRKNIEALAQANQLAVESMQAIARRQSEIFRSMMEEASSAMREVMAAGSPEEKAARQTEIVKDAFQRAVQNMRELAELVAKSQTEAMDVVQKRVADSLDEIKTVIAKKK
ncbi:MAG: phasin family protein [Proteobacteria bacterium]|nr:phasin family protein [Pseudomonadota bacterium]